MRSHVTVTSIRHMLVRAFPTPPPSLLSMVYTRKDLFFGILSITALDVRNFHRNRIDECSVGIFLSGRKCSVIVALSITLVYKKDCSMVNTIFRRNIQWFVVWSNDNKACMQNICHGQGHQDSYAAVIITVTKELGCFSSIFGLQQRSETTIALMFFSTHFVHKENSKFVRQG